MDRPDNYQEALVRLTRRVRSLPEAHVVREVAQLLTKPGLLDTFSTCVRRYVGEEDRITQGVLARLAVLDAETGARLLLEPTALKLLDLFKTVYFWEKAYPGGCRELSLEQRRAELAKHTRYRLNMLPG